MPDDRRTLVLVADDEPTMRTLVADRLRGQGFKVLEAADGDEAWQLAQESLPDLVVLDVMMPGMTGWEVCRKIRDAVSLAHTGVVMLTGIGERLNEMTSPLYGADAHIDKPFEFVDLEATIRETLAQRRGAPAHIGSGGETPRLEGKLRAVKSSDIRRAAARKKADGGPRRTAPKLREAPPTRNAPALTPASRKRRAKGKQLTLFDERPSAVSRAGTAPAQQPATGKSGKTPAKQTSAKKATAKKATAKKASAKKASAKKASAKKASAKKASAKKASAKKASAKQASAKQTSAKQASAKQASAKQASAKQASAKQASAKQTTAKQTSAKQASAKQTSAKQRR